MRRSLRQWRLAFVKEPTSEATVLVWDGGLRIFHWSLAASVTGAWATQELGPAYMDWHMAFGCAALALVVWRLAWGFVGPRTARFSDFVRPPREMTAYVNSLRSGPKQRFSGHNPLGAFSVVAMLALVLIQALTGLGNSDDIFFDGPWHHVLPDSVSDRLSYIHSVNFWILVTLIALHVGAIFAHWLFLRENLVVPMLSGKKPRRETAEGTGIAGQKPGLALALALASAALVGLLVGLAPEPPPMDFDMF